MADQEAKHDSVIVINAGDGLFDALMGRWEAEGWTLHPMDRHGIVYEARRPRGHFGPGETEVRKAA